MLVSGSYTCAWRGQSGLVPDTLLTNWNKQDGQGRAFLQMSSKSSIPSCTLLSVRSISACILRAAPMPLFQAATGIAPASDCRSVFEQIEPIVRREE